MIQPARRYPDEPEKTEDEAILDTDAVNILIVDDLPEKLLAYEIVLEGLGQNIITARSGEEALKQVLKHEFAVILLDVNMPGMDGFETATLIRSRKKSAKTPIIFLTAFTDDINAAQGYASGAVDYLPTPVVPEVLRAKIRVFIELFQMRRQAAAQAEERAKREAAEEADRRKDEFLAILAHELRNPLAPLRNALHLLQVPGLKPEVMKQAHEMMNRQLQHMVRLVDDLMDVSRITRGKIDLRMEHISLSDAIENAVETVRPLIEEKQHKIAVDLPKQKIFVNADLVRLSQIFGNLLNNAAKYTDFGGKITFSAEQQGNLAIIRIKDTGIGIAPEKLPYIFDLFTQVDSSLTRAQGGLGIGLTLVKNLIEMQSGSIEAISGGLNAGSEFIVRLPALPQKNTIKLVAENSEPGDSKQKKLRIIIVDDNEAAARTMGWMLEMEGHEIHTCFSSTEAVSLAQKVKPHVALLDIGMPDVNGYEICAELKKEPALAKTIFVAQTGWGQEEHKRMSKAAGFDYHLVKPVGSKALQTILSTIQI